MRFLSCILVLFFTLPVSAQEPTDAPPGQPVAALIRTEVPGDELEDFGRAIDRVLRARVQDVDVVELSGSPALGLEDIQLMVGCLSESTECFDAFAAQLDVESLFLPSLTRAGDEYIISVSFFDARDDSMRTADRSAEGAVEESLIDALDGVVRELFGIPEPDPGPEVHEIADGGEEEVTPPPPRTETRWSPSVAGIIIGAVGVVGVGVGVGLRVAGNNDEDAWLSAPVGDEQQIDAALALRDSAETKKGAGNALLVGGLVLAALGATLTFVLGTETEVEVSAAFDRDSLGLTAGGRF